jgi:hypothetical protein
MDVASMLPPGLALDCSTCHVSLFEGVHQMSQEKLPGDTESARRTWRITAYIYAPMLNTSTSPPQVGDQLTFASRLTPKVVAYSNTVIALLASSPPVREIQQLPPVLNSHFL